MKIGIPILDDKIGEIPNEVAILLQAQPGIDPTPFGLTILANVLKTRTSCVYLVNNKPSSTLRREALALGKDLFKYETAGILSFVDAYSNYVGMPSEEKYTVKEPFSAESLIETVEIAIRGLRARSKNNFTVLDSISSYLDMGGELNEILYCIDCLKRGSVVLALFSAWKYPPKIVEKLKRNFNAVFAVKAVEELAILRNFMIPEKVAWKKIKKFSVPVKVLKPGGVKVYFPKILVTGPYKAGKSAIVKAISKTSVSVDRAGTTIALDHGYLDYKGFSSDIFGTPGQESFDPLLEYLAEDAVAVILVLDSTQPKTFIRAKQMLEKTRSYYLPLVVAANKQDLKNALPTKKIRAMLGLPKNIPILPTVATAKKGTGRLVDELFKRLVAS
ncbi:MAG: GTP-binding protein [Candidatus Thermoplasmatota archaeon]|nr:GTP-binding protein [Candidatus Thermoplasmatota archaeon]